MREAGEAQAIAEQTARVGDQTGGRVSFFLHTSEFWTAYRHMQARGVRFAEEPREEPYGHVVVFDLVRRTDLPRAGEVVHAF